MVEFVGRMDRNEMASLKAHIDNLGQDADRISRPTAVKQNKYHFSSVEKLSIVKRLALRRRVWFRALNPMERGILDITMAYVDNVKSSKLAKLLTAIVNKLQQAMETKIEKLTRTIGVPMAFKLSCLATSWGNKSARNWASDISFASFLALTHPNG